MEWLIYAAIGGLAGFFAGLLGIGGGAIIGPLLIVVFTSVLAFSGNIATPLAIGTALACIAINAVVSTITHAKHGHIDFSLMAPIAVGVTVGAFLGVPLALKIPPQILKLLIVGLLLHNAISLFVNKKHAATPKKRLPTKPTLIATTIIIGGISATAGVGGGIFIVPYLHRFGISIKQAIGVSAFSGFPLAVSATVAYILNGWNVHLPQGSLGFVYVPALIGISIFSAVSTRIGANMTAQLPTLLLRRVFCFVLFLIGGRLLWQTLSTVT